MSLLIHLSLPLPRTLRPNVADTCPLQSTLLDQWGTYLVGNTPFLADQLATTDFAGSLPNQTNLAVKGIIALEAMAVIEEKYHGDEEAARMYHVRFSASLLRAG